MRWLSKLFKKKEPEAIDGIPWYIIVGGWGIDVLESEDNVAKGEIVKLHFHKDSRGYKYNEQVVGLQKGYHWIWRSIGDDYFKVVGKWPEGPWTCQ